MPTAITRAVSPGIIHYELTHLERRPIDYLAAVNQHVAYETCLERLGYRVQQLPTTPEMPDSVFIEDTALVLEEVAVITRPGAASRRSETTAVADVLAGYRPVCFITPPGTLDGGDILRLGKRLFVGISGRSNPDGIRQLSSLLQAFGYTVQGVPLSGCLHLKSAVTQVSRDALLVNPRWVDPAVFGTWRLLEVDPQEPHAANALLLGEALVYPAAYTRTDAYASRWAFYLLKIYLLKTTKRME